MAEQSTSLWEMAGLIEAPVADQADVEYANDVAEAEEARAAIVARLERLARRVRMGTTTDMAQLDAAYSEIVKLAHVLKPILA